MTTFKKACNPTIRLGRTKVYWIYNVFGGILQLHKSEVLKNYEDYDVLLKYFIIPSLCMSVFGQQCRQ